jgi:diguanylate cyclase (GGDEF)-like protein
MTGQFMAFERHKTNDRVVQDLKKRSTIGIIFYILLSLIAIFADDFYSRHTSFSLIFLLSNTGICLFRLIHLRVYRKTGERYKTFNKGIFFSSVIVTALIWGLMLALIMLQEEEHVTKLITTVCVAGLCAGGVVAFIPHQRLSFFFNIAMLMPFVIIMLVNGLNLPIATMLFLYSVYLTFIAYRGNQEYWDALENEDLLEIKSLELARLSNTDVLTGLYNRRYFDDAMDREWKRSGRNNSLISIILMDIDHFKTINDTYGHQVGDDYLRKMAEILTSVFKRDSDIVARYGGEEFIILLPGVDTDHAFQLAEKATHKISSMIIDYQGTKVGTTISSGVSCCIPSFNSRSDSIIADADKALYMAKQRGRDQVVVHT